MRWLVALVLVAPVGAEPPDLDEVVCTWCHFDEGDDFAASVHYHEGHILCNDCHGGLPFEEDPDLAKAEGTGFIGKPMSFRGLKIRRCLRLVMGWGRAREVKSHQRFRVYGAKPNVSILGLRLRY